MNNTRYCAVRVVLHWLSAIVIVWTLVSGFTVALFDLGPGIKAGVGFVNVSLTTLLIPFFFWRLLLALRAVDVAYACPADRVASLAHWALYGVTSVVLVTGVLMMDRPIDVFGWFSLPAPLTDPALIEGFLRVHVWSCVVLAALVGLHVAAVIKHHWTGRRILARMWF